MRRSATSDPATLRRSEAGVTVVELLIAVLILAFALIGLASAIGPAVLATTQGGLQTVAVHLAQDRIEVAKRTAFSALEAELVASRAPVPGFGNFERRVEVQPYAPVAGCSAAPCAIRCPPSRSHNQSRLEH